MKKSDLSGIIKRVPTARKKATVLKAPAKRAPSPAKPIVPAPAPADDDPDFVPVGLTGIMAATEKLLAVNRGLIDPDERDSYAFKRIMSVDGHLGERIKLDAGKIRKGLMRNASKLKSLRGAHPFMFDSYGKGLLLGDPGQANPLSSPLEEINPLHILEQARRITQMGPGGIGSADRITESAQSVHPSQFGFVSAVEGPESERIGVDARLSVGVRIGSDGRLYQQFRNPRTNQMEWLTPEDLEGKVVRLPE